MQSEIERYFEQLNRERTQAEFIKVSAQIGQDTTLQTVGQGTEAGRMSTDTTAPESAEGIESNPNLWADFSRQLARQLQEDASGI